MLSGASLFRPALSAASVDVLLGQFADITDGFRAADFQSADRVALTSRLLRLQSALPSVGATFAVSCIGPVAGGILAIFRQ